MKEETTRNPIKNILTIVVSMVFAVGFMYLAFQDLDVQSIKKTLLKANYLWVLVSMFFGVLAYWIRAIRWNLLLEPLGYRISHTNALWTLSFGYLMNLTIPRSGEIVRSTALYGVEKVPVDKSFGTIILERVVDLCCMFIFLGLTLIFKYDAIEQFRKKANININPTLLVGGILLMIFVFFIFFIFKEKLKKIGLIHRIIIAIEGVMSGMLAIFRLKHKWKFILYTMGIWGAYYGASYLICFALPETENFTIADGFFIIVVGTLGMIVPASGGIGAFHYALKMGISMLFLSMSRDPEQGAEVGLSYAFLSHTVQLVIILIMGLISIPMLAKNKKSNQ